MTDSNPVIERHVSFFLKEGFWAGMKPDFSKFSSQYWIQPQYSALFEEVVFSKKDGDREVSFTRDGMIRYSDPGLLQEIGDEPHARIDKYTSILNALQLAVISQIAEDTKILYHDYFEVTHLDVIGSTTWRDGSRSMGVPNKSVTNKQLQRRYLSYVPHNMVDSIDQYAEGDHAGRPVVSLATLERATDKFFAITKNDASTKLASRTTKALSEYVSTSFSDAVIIAWTQLEIYLHEKMQEYASLNTERFTTKRKKNLKDLTSSQTIELLEVAGLLTTEEYTKISNVRKNRNKIIHEGSNATFNDATEALLLIESIIAKKTGQNVKLALGIRMSLF